MDRTFLITIIFVLVFIIAVILGVSVWFLPLTSEKKVTQTDPVYFSFSNTDTVFESLQQEPQIESAIVNSQSPEEQGVALQQIIRAWEERPGSPNFRTDFETFSASSTTTESEELSSLFKTLIGSSVLDTLAQQNKTGEFVDELLWNGNYSKITPVVLADDTSKTQEEFRIFGNELATLLTAFNVSQGDQTKLLTVFIENRESTKQLERLTTGYLQLASDIADLEVPEQLNNIQADLVSSYTLVGELLWNLTLATDDESLMERMLIYNSASEKVARAHISLVTLFKSYGVVFKSYEPGRIFTFSL
ncbi:MAG: hypothetical protein CMI56_02645 [Parcubacteria group bacterium]|nr:hypothetical protein [Parcubacteria group bacterium]|tara:strand:- start:6630 stop:7544 length:915 start_codon:yes stop_codon:yes gene_type:complete